MKVATWRNCPLSLVSLMPATPLKSLGEALSLNSSREVRKVYSRSDFRRSGRCDEDTLHSLRGI